MTPDTIAEAVYEIGHAAGTEHDASLGGVQLGRMLAAQFKAQGTARRRLGSASRAEIERTLEQLTSSSVSYQGQVASDALEAWRHSLSIAGCEKLNLMPDENGKLTAADIPIRNDFMRRVSPDSCLTSRLRAFVFRYRVGR